MVILHKDAISSLCPDLLQKLEHRQLFLMHPKRTALHLKEKTAASFQCHLEHLNANFTGCSQKQ